MTRWQKWLLWAAAAGAVLAIVSGQNPVMPVFWFGAVYALGTLAVRRRGGGE